MFASLLGTCGEQVMCWRYSCQNGYAILAQVLPLWSKHSKNTVLPSDHGFLVPSGKWEGHDCLLFFGGNGCGWRGGLHATWPSNNWSCAGRSWDGVWEWPSHHQGDPGQPTQGDGEGDVRAGAGAKAWCGCGSFWRQSPSRFRPTGRTSLHGDHADSREGDADNPGGPEHTHLHHWRLGILVAGLAWVSSQIC